MKLSAIQCPKCKNIIFSRSRHDFRYCSCKEVAVDGGFEYFKISYTPGIIPIMLEIYLIGKLDISALYKDWNFKIDKFGIIKTKGLVDPKFFKYTLNNKGKFYKYILPDVKAALKIMFKP